MNPLTQTRNQMKLNDRELELGIAGTKNSWHQEYKDSAWIFMGGMPYQLTEGDVICMFSQYGEVVHINLIRDHTSGKSKGFGFLCYEDQRSTILAVDNLNGFKILDRMIRVDHIHQYKLPKDLEKLDQDKLKLFQEGVAPKAISEEPSSSEEDEFEVKEEKKKKKKKDKKKHKKKKKKKDKGKSESSEDSDREDQLKASKPAEETNGSARQRSPYRREGQPEERQTERRRQERSASPKKRERSRDRKERDEVSRRERRRSKSRDRRSRSRDRRDRSRDRRSRSRDRRRDRS